MTIHIDTILADKLCVILFLSLSIYTYNQHSIKIQIYISQFPSVRQQLSLDPRTAIAYEHIINANACLISLHILISTQLLAKDRTTERIDNCKELRSTIGGDHLLSRELLCMCSVVAVCMISDAIIKKTRTHDIQLYHLCFIVDVDIRDHNIAANFWSEHGSICLIFCGDIYTLSIMFYIMLRCVISLENHKHTHPNQVTAETCIRSLRLLFVSATTRSTHHHHNFPLPVHMCGYGCVCVYTLV